MARRMVRVGTVSHHPSHGVDTPENEARLMAEAERLIERAARMGAELVAFPECYPQLAVGDVFHHAEPADGGTLTRARESAARHGLYLVWPRAEYDPGRGGLRNTSILIGRDGGVVGRYDKMFPTEREIAAGCVPGTDCPIFETDFGRVGLLICFDLNFREVRDRLAEQEPDLVVFSSMYRGGRQLEALAFELGSFVVSAVRPELGRILDRCGGLVKETTYETLGVAELNTNSVAMHMDNNWGKMDAMLARYGPALRFDYHTREAYFVISGDEGVEVRDVEREFELESARDYFERSRRLRGEALMERDP